jgi:hypothetical protein
MPGTPKILIWNMYIKVRKYGQECQNPFIGKIFPITLSSFLDNKWHRNNILKKQNYKATSNLIQKHNSKNMFTLSSLTYIKTCKEFLCKNKYLCLNAPILLLLVCACLFPYMSLFTSLPNGNATILLHEYC